MYSGDAHRYREKYTQDGVRSGTVGMVGGQYQSVGKYHYPLCDDITFQAMPMPVMHYQNLSISAGNTSYCQAILVFAS